MNQLSQVGSQPCQSPLPDLQLHVLLKLYQAKPLEDLSHSTAVLADPKQHRQLNRLELRYRLWLSLGSLSSLQTSDSVLHTALGLWLYSNPEHHQKLNYGPSEDHETAHPQNPQILYQQKLWSHPHQLLA